MKLTSLSAYSKKATEGYTILMSWPSLIEGSTSLLERWGLILSSNIAVICMVKKIFHQFFGSAANWGPPPHPRSPPIVSQLFSSRSSHWWIHSYSNHQAWPTKLYQEAGHGPARSSHANDKELPCLKASYCMHRELFSTGELNLVSNCCPGGGVTPSPVQNFWIFEGP